MRPPGKEHCCKMEINRALLKQGHFHRKIFTRRLVRMSRTGTNSTWPTARRLQRCEPCSRAIVSLVSSLFSAPNTIILTINYSRSCGSCKHCGIVEKMDLFVAPTQNGMSDVLLSPQRTEIPCGEDSFTCH